MKTVAFVLAAAAAAAASASTDGAAKAMNKAMVEDINSRELTWRADFNWKLFGATVSDVQRLLGTDLEGNAATIAKMPVKDATHPDVASAVQKTMPTEFNTATNWPKCASVVNHIRDQAGCGSCWAFGSTEALNDRLCIKSEGDFTTELSAQDTASCCNLFGGCFGSQGCDGGQPAEAWQYFQRTGVVTGGDYGTKEGCFPYALPNCCHHVKCPYGAACTEGGSTPACPNPKACPNSAYTAKEWADDKHYAASAYSLQGVQAIMADIQAHGSVTAAFSVYADFLTYKSGVYQHTTGQLLGGHAIKIIGWGVENSTPYWLVANSWNTYWGAGGFFKILRGQDECGIESQVVAGLPGQ